MLLPVLNAARERGRAVSCTNNMKTLGTAMLLYAQDYQDLMPLAGNRGAVWYYGIQKNAWPYLLNHHYLGGKAGTTISAVFQCPGNDSRNLSGTYNGKLDYACFNSYGADGTWDAVISPIKLSRIPNASSAGLFLEYQTQTQARLASCGMDANFRLVDNWYWEKLRIAYRHARESILNVAYLDGHVGQLRRPGIQNMPSDQLKIFVCRGKTY